MSNSSRVELGTPVCATNRLRLGRPTVRKGSAFPVSSPLTCQLILRLSLRMRKKIFSRVR